MKAGATVTIVGRSPATLEQAIVQGDAHAAAVADVTDREAVQAAVQDAVARYGPVDLLIANAGAAASAPFMKTGPDMFRQMLDVNLLGVTNTAHAVLGSMTERGFGRIVAVASTAGLKGYPYVSAYCAAKHAVVGFVRALALETARNGVTVNAVCPGFTDTDLVSESLERIMEKTDRTREEALARAREAQPAGQAHQPVGGGRGRALAVQRRRALRNGTGHCGGWGRNLNMDDHAIPLDAETKAVEMPEDHREELRLWLRLLTCSTLIEGEVRRRLRERFDVTLPRFDLMAQLDKAPDGMTLSDLSKRMMVSNGNLTGLVDRLVTSGHIARIVSPTDRRAMVISLTEAGRAEFRTMAGEHEHWIADLFGDLNAKDRNDLMRLLAKTKLSARRAIMGDDQ